MCVSVVGEFEEGIGEGAAGDFAVDGLATVLADSVGELDNLVRAGSQKTWREAYLECVELHVGIAMSKALDQALDDLFGAVGVTGYLVADLDDGAPVLRGEVLVRCLGCAGLV